MDPDHLRQAIDAEIKSLEASIQALRYRRNALAPISSLPTEVVTTIFTFLHIPATLSSFTLGEQPKRSEQLAWLRVAHVCRQWREIALNLPHLWNHVDFTIVSSAGAAEILSRAKGVPLYLEARVPCHFWDDTRFSALQEELQDHVSHISHLRISAESFRLRGIFKGLVSPAPTLELLSLSGVENTTVSGNITGIEKIVVPDTLFDGSTPRLSYLELCNCDTTWNSPLLWGLKHLHIRTPFDRPSLSVWLDALGQMPQLKTLVLYWASPVAPPGASLLPDVDRTVTLPSLTLFDISSRARECGLALAHLTLPALASLCIDAKSYSQDGSDVQEILPYVARHAHGSQDTQPLQSMWFSRSEMRAKVLAWTLPDIDVDFSAVFESMPSARVAFSVVGDSWSPGFETAVFDMVTKALPLDDIVTLTAQNRTMTLYKNFWLLNAPRWPLLQRVRLTPIEERGFMEMLLDDRRGRESPLLPLLTTLILVDTALLERRTLHLCDALMKRVEEGVALETLDLRECLATSRAIELLSEIVVDVLGPEETFETGSQIRSESVARGICLDDEEDENSVVDEDNDEDSADTGSDDEVEDT
ncbi:hypothetical protein EDB83DRAFT_2531055 [Lactarius deliciosus]|nr:hypothetical protein EDB83DRAFT_2531055 [Lactarius deliciosus]